MGQIEAPL